MSPLFEASAASFRYPGAARGALEHVDLTIHQGSFCALIGPNGSGKSTLLKLLLGVLRPVRGTVLFDGRAAADWDRRAFARRVGVVAQLEEILFPATVWEFVMMGRYPHLGPWQRERAADRAAVVRALERCDIAPLAERSVLELSGGERQRARVARALAQEPTVLVLDEPTAALDLGHEMAVFELLAALCRQDRVTVITATHNLNHAARFAGQLTLLSAGRAVATGTPAQVISQSIVEQVYQWPVRVFPHDGPGEDRGAPQIVPLIRSIESMEDA
jgi:iron complex transport system ATP-binding protein